VISFESLKTKTERISKPAPHGRGGKRKVRGWGSREIRRADLKRELELDCGAGGVPQGKLVLSRA